MPQIDEQLKVILAEHIERWEQELIELEVMPEYVHLLVGCNLQVGIHCLVKFAQKASRHIRFARRFALKRRLPSLWTNSYFVATTGGIMLEAFKRYAQNHKGC